MSFRRQRTLAPFADGRFANDQYMCGLIHEVALGASLSGLSLFPSFESRSFTCLTSSSGGRGLFAKESVFIQ